jgi:hypothetical protein
MVDGVHNFKAIILFITDTAVRYYFILFFITVDYVYFTSLRNPEYEITDALQITVS